MTENPKQKWDDYGLLCWAVFFLRRRNYVYLMRWLTSLTANALGPHCYHSCPLGDKQSFFLYGHKSSAVKETEFSDKTRKREKLAQSATFRCNFFLTVLCFIYLLRIGIWAVLPEELENIILVDRSRTSRLERHLSSSIFGVA